MLNRENHLEPAENPIVRSKWLKPLAALTAAAVMNGCGLIEDESAPEAPAETYRLCQQWQQHPELWQDQTNADGTITESPLKQAMRTEATASLTWQGGGFAPGAAVVVGCGNTVLVSLGLGETGSGPGEIPSELVSPSETVYDLSSVTKFFTSIAIIILAREGKLGPLGLDQPIGQFLPDVSPGYDPYDVDPQKAQITFRHLITHRSGINEDQYSEVTNRCALPTDSGCSQSVLSGIQEYPLERAPGSANRYSNFGFVLAYVAGSQAAGKPLSEVIKEKILDPLGMEHSGYYPEFSNCAPTSPDENQSEILPRCLPQDKLARHQDNKTGHASLDATAENLAKLEQAILNGSLLTPEEVQLMSTFTGNNYDDGIYGTGAMVNVQHRFSDYMSEQAFGHTGANGNLAIGDPLSGMFAIYLSNGSYLRELPDGKTAIFKRLNDTFGSFSAAVSSQP